MGKHHEKDVTASVLEEMSKTSLEMEKARTESLVRLANTLLTCVSILSVALISIASPLYGFFSAMPYVRLVVVVGVMIGMLLLIADLILVLLSQRRFAYEALPSPNTLCDCVDTGEVYERLEAARNMCVTYGGMYDAESANNEKRCRLLKAAITVLIIAIGLMAAFAIVLFFVALGTGLL